MFTFANECRGFAAGQLDQETERALSELTRKCRGDILTMTTLAKCGHPGGSMSSVDMAAVLYALAGTDPRQPDRPDRNRILFSHGHISPCAYSVLGNLGFFPEDEAIAHFRQAGGPFEGHVEHGVPGLEWSSGNLGQGLSAGCGMALASRTHGFDNQVFVMMGDGEQQKGQIGEARRFAVKYGLHRLTCLADINGLQISGETGSVMPQNIRSGFAADGWRTIEINGHDFREIYQALRDAIHDRDHCVAILAATVMGKGVSFMENLAKWHGQTLDETLYHQAMLELGQQDRLDYYREMRRQGTAHLKTRPRQPMVLPPPAPETRQYTTENKMDNRTAWGKALEDLARMAVSRPDRVPIAVFDCDLASSVKTSGFSGISPTMFFQSGIMEHHTAVCAGAMSTQQIQVFWADFGVFGVDEVYNQLRINDINETNLKVVCTHIGTDVGEDGKTHHCIDYLGLLRNLFHFRVVVPADPNQTDRAVRWAASQPGNCFIGMGRSVNPVLTGPDGQPFFGPGYHYEYGKADILRAGKQAAILAMGMMVARAVRAADELSREGIEVMVLNCSSPLAIDPAALEAAAATGLIVTYEDHHIHTGLGSAVAAKILESGLQTGLQMMGIQEYATSGTPEDILVHAGLDVESLKATIRRRLKE